MRYALVIGNSEYDDETLARLKSPITDTQALAKALNDPQLGQFDSVISLVNQPEPVMRRGISQFLAQKKPDDLVVLYFSCHGILDERGRLYLAVKDTQRDLLKATGISTSFITDEMDSCRSRRQVLILDCCYGGAFARGSKGSHDKALSETTFEGAGYGRVVLTASDSTQFALEGDQVVEQAELSLFTHFLLNGLTTGDADLNRDGQVTLDELYDYTYTQVVSQTPRQTPCKWSYNQQGDLLIARNPRPIEIKPAEMPPELREALDNPYSSVRLGAIEALRRMLESKDAGTALAAKMALEHLSTDDSRSVSEAAVRLLAGMSAAAVVEAPKAPVVPQTSPTVEVRQEAPAAPSGQADDQPAANPPAAEKNESSLTANQLRNFWLAWVGSFLAGVVLFLMESNIFNTIYVDYMILPVLSFVLVGAVVGTGQWLVLRKFVHWAGWWLVGNIVLLAGLNAIAFMTYSATNGLIGDILLITWIVFDLAVGPWLALREIRNTPKVDMAELESPDSTRTPSVPGWQFWLQWVGYPLLVMLFYYIAYDQKIQFHSEYYGFSFPLLMVSGGVAALLQWSLLSQYRSNVVAWVPLNILALGIVATFTSDDSAVQRVLLLTWFIANQLIGAVLVLTSKGSLRKEQAADSQILDPPGMVFWLVWVGMIPVGFGMAYLGQQAIDNAGAENSPNNYFIMMVIIGGIVGLGQWLVLRRWLPGSAWWIAANAVCLGWVGYLLSPWHSDTMVGNILGILYLLANLAIGPGMIYLKLRQSK